VELSLVTASGKGGRVEQQDVQDFLDSLEDDEDGETEMMGSYGPAVRRMGREHGIDLSQVRPSGTGPGGKAEVILKEDVLEYMAAQRQGPGAQGDRTVAVSGFQRAMAKKMEEALRVPHFTFCDEVNMDKLVELRAMLKPACEAKLTYMPFFIKAASLALHKTPILNSHLSPTAEELTYKADHNISIAVNSAKGLVVPNIKAVQSQSVFEIAGELERLVALAQEGTLPADDLADGTFALSNIGAIGGTYATPVVMTPQVAIGALGRLQTLPRYDDEMNVVPARLISASWSADHRIIDGATMAQFAIDWKALIERPELMLAQLR
jgi:2-oxoisovalerate dehydrogenase E2 component (dihydrolipoyl transacylase)